jgi:hypothetical protein
MTDKKFSNLDKLEVIHAWGIFQNSSAKLIIQELINNVILSELQTFEYIDADKFASQKAKIEGMRQILGTFNLPEDMILKTLKL